MTELTIMYTEQHVACSQAQLPKTQDVDKVIYQTDHKDKPYTGTCYYNDVTQEQSIRMQLADIAAYLILRLEIHMVVWELVHTVQTCMCQRAGKAMQ